VVAESETPTLSPTLNSLLLRLVEGIERLDLLLEKQIAEENRRFEELKFELLIFATKLAGTGGR